MPWSAVQGQFISVVLVWWAYLPIAWLNQGLSGFTAAGDPRELARRAEEREEQIRDRERATARSRPPGQLCGPKDEPKRETASVRRGYLEVEP